MRRIQARCRRFSWYTHNWQQSNRAPRASRGDLALLPQPYNDLLHFSSTNEPISRSISMCLAYLFHENRGRNQFLKVKIEGRGESRKWWSLKDNKNVMRGIEINLTCAMAQKHQNWCVEIGGAIYSGFFPVFACKPNSRWGRDDAWRPIQWPNPSSTHAVFSIEISRNVKRNSIE